MKKNIIRRILTIFVVPVLCLVLPVLLSDKFQSFVGKKAVDAVSSSSIVIEQPSGECTVFINKKLHRDKEKLAVWQEFFEGREIPVIFEDITCAVPVADVAGLEMAASFQSRLPEHQMEIEREDTTLLLSKAEYEKVDVLLLSKEFVKAFGAESLYDGKHFAVIHVQGTVNK